GTLDQFWLWSMQCGLKNAYESIKAFSETDFSEDLRKFDVPTLVMHGEDDQIVPVKNSARKSAQLIKGAVEIYYPGLSHGLTASASTETCSPSARKKSGWSPDSADSSGRHQVGPTIPGASSMNLVQHN